MTVVMAGTGRVAPGELWKAYKATGDRLLRNDLIEHYSSMVRSVAASLATELPIDGIDVDDLFSWGILALADAIERFDLDRGWKFETYAMIRVRFGIIDELRDIDWAPRSVRRNGVAIQRAINALATSLRRMPGEEDLADYLGVDVEQLSTMRRDAFEAGTDSLDATFSLRNNVEAHDSALCLEWQLHTSDPGPEEALWIGQIQGDLCRALAELDDRDRVVLALVHREGLTCAEVGEALDVSRTRASQLHTEAVQALRARLERRSA